MKTTIVPAQVTTVEDRIAGNFTFMQIVLLIIPLILGTAVYVLVPPRSDFSWIKLVTVGLFFLVFGTLAIRIRDRLVIEWLVILFRYILRPRKYVFTKKDISKRVIEKIEKVKKNKKIPLTKTASDISKLSVSLGEQNKIDRLFNSPSLSYRFRLAKKGGVNVSLNSKEN